MKAAAQWLAYSFLFVWAAAGPERTDAAALQVSGTPTNSSPHFITLREAVRAALLNNRMLQIERINPEIARMTLKASWGYYDPLVTSRVRKQNQTEVQAFDPDNPALDTGFTSESEVIDGGLTGFLPSGLTYTIVGNYNHSQGTRDLNFDSYRMGAGIDLRQPLLRNLWIDQPRYLIRVSKRDLQISEAGVNFVAMTVLNEVQQAYYDLVFAWENLIVQENLSNTRQQFLKTIDRQVELGMLTVLEQRVAASQYAAVQTTLVEASNTLALAGNNLRGLMGVTGTNWTQAFFIPVDRLAVMPESLDLATSWQRGLAKRPDLIQMVKNLEKQNINVKYRRNQLFPSLDLIGAYGRRGASSIQAFPPDQPQASSSEAWSQFERGDAPSDMIGILLSFPLTKSVERANFTASKELKKQAELMVKQKEEVIAKEVSDAIHTARFSYDRVQAARRATEFAEAALKAQEELLRTGKSSIDFVLDRQADLADAQTAEVEARQAYNRAISQLHFAEGTILEQHNLAFEFE
jgi:outer membrane protein TolC